MVKQYNKSADGGRFLSKNFRVKEFACPCSRCSEILIDDGLVEMGQKIRDFFGKPVYISSGYRCWPHNTEIGGAKDSNHPRGKAMDFDVGSGRYMVDHRIVAMAAEAFACTGVGRYIYANGQAWVHISVNGKNIKRWTQAKPGAQVYIETFLPSLRKPLIAIKVFEVGVMQHLLAKLGHYKLEEDQKFGGGTLKALKAFQQAAGLAVDGVCGPKSWAALFKAVKVW